MAFGETVSYIRLLTETKCMTPEEEGLSRREEEDFKFVCIMSVCIACLTTPGSFISAIRYSGSPAGGSTTKVNSGLGGRKFFRLCRDSRGKENKKTAV